MRTPELDADHRAERGGDREEDGGGSFLGGEKAVVVLATREGVVSRFWEGSQATWCPMGPPLPATRVTLTPGILGTLALAAAGRPGPRVDAEPTAFRHVRKAHPSREGKRGQRQGRRCRQEVARPR